MRQAIDNLTAAIAEVRPHLDALSNIEARTEAAERDAAMLEKQVALRQEELVKVRAEVEHTRTVTQKQQTDVIEARKAELRSLLQEIDAAKAHLVDLQTTAHAEHERWQGLARKANKLEASLG